MGASVRRVGGQGGHGPGRLEIVSTQLSLSSTSILSISIQLGFVSYTLCELICHTGNIFLYKCMFVCIKLLHFDDVQETMPLHRH